MDSDIEQEIFKAVNHLEALIRKRSDDESIDVVVIYAPDDLAELKYMTHLSPKDTHLMITVMAQSMFRDMYDGVKSLIRRMTDENETRH